MKKTLLSAAVVAALLSGPLLSGTHAQTSAPAAAVPDKKDASKTSAGVAAMRDRQKKCGAEWKEAKAAGKIEKGTTWPKYWSACNKRLKEADAKKG